MHINNIIIIYPYSVLDDIKHVGRIADSMSEWEGAVGDALELTYADREAIKAAHPGKLNLQTLVSLSILYKE